MAPEDRGFPRYAGSMKAMLWLACAFAALPAAGQVLASRPIEQTELEAGAYAESPDAVGTLGDRPEPRVLVPDVRSSQVFEGPVGGAAGKGLRPIYRGAEAAADAVYELLRRRVVGPMLGGRYARGLEPAPDRDSYAKFEQALRKREDRFAGRLLERYPHQALDGSGMLAREQRMQQWRDWAFEEQRFVIVSAFEDALLARYGLDRFGEYSEDYAQDRRNWDPQFLTMAALLGGAFAYLNGVHAEVPWGPARVRVSLRAGYLIQRAAAADGRARLGDIQLAYKNVPVRLGVEWAVSDGRVVRDTIGLRYQKRF